MTAPPPTWPDEFTTKPDQALLTTSPVESTWEAGSPVHTILSDVMSQTSSIAESGWGLYLRSEPTLTPPTSVPSESSRPSSEKGNGGAGGSSNTDIVYGITFGALGFLILALIAVIVFRGHQGQNTLNEPEPVVTGNQQRRLGHTWRIEAGLPVPERVAHWAGPRVRGRRHEREQAPIELRSRSAVGSASARQSQGHGTVVSPTTEQVISSSSTL
ncbi:hypothetical protein F5X97DRAFT_121410 [Nemania serpens]|nr:hypothetical protein F5X97DRAFT_121410 [Nemania serpens]